MQKVTIGIPFLNNAATLDDAICSVLAQTHTNWELILIDDGSADGSLEITQSFKDPRVVVLTDGANRGLAARLNQLAQCAATEFLFRMDADDVMHPDRVAFQLERLNRPDRPDLVGSSVWVVTPEGRVLGRRRTASTQTFSSKEVLLNRVGIVHPSVAGRTAWFRLHRYDESLRRTQDRELWVRSLDSTKYVHLDVPLLFYRESQSVNLSNYRLAMRAQSQMLKHYGPRLLGPRRTALEFGKRYGREAVMAIASCVGRSDVLIGRRYDLVPLEELIQAQAEWDHLDRVFSRLR